MRKQAATLDDQTGGGGEQHHPSGISTFGDQDTARRRGCGGGVLYHAHAATHEAGTRAKSATFLAITGALGWICSGFKLICLVGGFVRFEPVWGSRLKTHLVEFALAKTDDFFEVRCGRGAVYERQDLFDLEIENVAGILQEVQCAQPMPDLHENTAHAAEDARTFEAQILATADSDASVPENPNEDQTTKRTAVQGFIDALLGESGGGFRIRNARGRNAAREFTNTTQQERRIIV
jgi:hypothetical protein